jgi:hypothetical protein
VLAVVAAMACQPSTVPLNSIFVVAPFHPPRTLPQIMIWIYGGSWELGSGSVPIYDGMFDVHLEEDVIIVTLNYRCVARREGAASPLHPVAPLFVSPTGSASLASSPASRSSTSPRMAPWATTACKCVAHWNESTKDAGSVT